LYYRYYDKQPLHILQVTPDFKLHMTNFFVDMVHRDLKLDNVLISTADPTIEYDIKVKIPTQFKSCLKVQTKNTAIYTRSF